MNLFIIIRKFLPEEVGGNTIYVYQLAKSAVKEGYKVRILCSTSDSNLPKYERMNGIDVHRIYVKNRPWSNILRAYKFLKLYRTLNNNHKELNIINFHSRELFPFFFSGLKNKKNSIITTFHACIPSSERINLQKVFKMEAYHLNKIKESVKIAVRYFPYYFLERGLLKFSKKVFVMSNFIKKLFLRYHGEKYREKISVFPVGISLNKFKPVKNKDKIREKLGIPKNLILLLTVRRLDTVSLENLIYAIKKVVEEFKRKNFMLLIVGDGILRGRLNTLISKYDLSKFIKLMGFIPHNKLPMYYQACDAFVFPAEENEGFGIVTIEALASNLPVLTIPAGAMPEVLKELEKKLGLKLLADDETPDSFAEILLSFLDNFSSYTNTNLYRTFAKERYNKDRIFKKVLEKYRT